MKAVAARKLSCQKLWQRLEKLAISADDTAATIKEVFGEASDQLADGSWHTLRESTILQFAIRHKALKLYMVPKSVESTYELSGAEFWEFCMTDAFLAQNEEFLHGPRLPTFAEMSDTASIQFCDTVEKLKDDASAHNALVKKI